MGNSELNCLFSRLSTPLIADACVRLKLAIRMAPVGLTPLLPDSKVAGLALPVKHKGSVDVFLEAMLGASPGDILCIDNNGRMDEGCIGDLTALEAWTYGIAALAVWGCHRDTDELVKIGLPVYSYGRCPAGPQKLERTKGKLIGSAMFGTVQMGADDVVFIDSDGALFVQSDQVKEVLIVAKQIGETESLQAQSVREGTNLHSQFRFNDFLEKRSKQPSYTFREHLRSMAKSIEE